MRIRNRLAVAAVALAPLVLFGSPAEAVGSGQIAFGGHVTFPRFPCSGPGCVASFDASFASGTGISTETATAVVTGLRSMVTYDEVCTGGQPATGTATGSLTLTGTNVTGELLPLTAPFRWIRSGLVAVIASDALTGTGPALTGAALFVPDGGQPACTGASTRAAVIGSVKVCFFADETGVVCVYA